MPSLPTTPISLREDIFRGTQPLRVDREKGVIHGAKLLGLQSSNGRSYTLDAIRKAAGLYEGKVVNIDHRSKPGHPRSAYDRFGRVINVLVTAEGLFGDIEYLKSHPMADRISEAAERMPGIFGMSHDAHGIPRPGKNNKTLTIESITSVSSVDVVSDPATVKGLFENLQQGYEMEPEMMVPAGSPDEQLKAGFKAAIMAVVDDESMDVTAKISKIRDLLKTHEKLMGGGETEMSSDEAPAEEQIQPKIMPEPTTQDLQEQVQQFSRREKVRALCDQAGLLPTAIQLKALVALTEEADVKALVEQFRVKPATGTNNNGNAKPRSVSPVQLAESKSLPADATAFARAITR